MINTGYSIEKFTSDRVVFYPGARVNLPDEDGLGTVTASGENETYINKGGVLYRHSKRDIRYTPGSPIYVKNTLKGNPYKGVIGTVIDYLPERGNIPPKIEVLLSSSGKIAHFDVSEIFYNDLIAGKITAQVKKVKDCSLVIQYIKNNKITEAEITPDKVSRYNKGFSCDFSEECKKMYRKIILPPSFQEVQRKEPDEIEFLFEGEGEQVAGFADTQRTGYNVQEDNSLQIITRTLRRLVKKLQAFAQIKQSDTTSERKHKKNNTLILESLNILQFSNYIIDSLELLNISENIGEHLYINSDIIRLDSLVIVILYNTFFNSEKFKTWLKYAYTRDTFDVKGLEKILEYLQQADSTNYTQNNEDIDASLDLFPVSKSIKDDRLYCSPLVSIEAIEYFNHKVLWSHKHRLVLDDFKDNFQRLTGLDPGFHMEIINNLNLGFIDFVISRKTDSTVRRIYDMFVKELVKRFFTEETREYLSKVKSSLVFEKLQTIRPLTHFESTIFKFKPRDIEDDMEIEEEFYDSERIINEYIWDLESIPYKFFEKDQVSISYLETPLNTNVRTVNNIVMELNGGRVKQDKYSNLLYNQATKVQ